MAGFRYIVSGTVQGVGFRAYVSREAQALGLRGFVRNRSDGTVEVEAYGSEPQLQGLAAVLARGPRGARVTRVATSDIPEGEGPAAFTVRYDAE